MSDDLTTDRLRALDWPTLANIIREVDGNHDLGAGELAERILTHPKVSAAAPIPGAGCTHDCYYHTAVHATADDLLRKRVWVEIVKHHRNHSLWMRRPEKCPHERCVSLVDFYEVLEGETT